MYYTVYYVIIMSYVKFIYLFTYLLTYLLIELLICLRYLFVSAMHYELFCLFLFYLFIYARTKAHKFQFTAK